MCMKLFTQMSNAIKVMKKSLNIKNIFSVYSGRYNLVLKSPCCQV